MLPGVIVCSGVEPRLMGSLRPAKSPRYSSPGAGGGFSQRGPPGGGYRGYRPRYQGNFILLTCISEHAVFSKV